MTETTDALVLDLVEWIGARAAALFRGDRDVAHLMPAPDHLGGRRRSRLCHAPDRRPVRAYASRSLRSGANSCASTAAAR